MGGNWRIAWLVPGMALALGSTLALGGCGGAGDASSSQSAADLLTRAQTATLRDATFSLTLAITTPASGASAPTVASQQGTGFLTTNPYRQDITLTTSADGLSIPLEMVTDGQNLFTRVPSSSTWRQQPADASTRFLDEHLSAPTLVGAETLKGVATWHLRGTLSTSMPHDTEDLWLRQDNYLPLKSSLHAANEDGTAITATLTFSKWNTGATVALPAPSAIQPES
jgi:hypothetical protein